MPDISNHEEDESDDNSDDNWGSVPKKNTRRNRLVRRQTQQQGKYIL